MAALALRPYQKECVDQAVDRQNLLIAMVMGAGKTAAALRTVRTLRQMGEVTSGAIFALNSTKFQWLEEIAKWDRTALAQVVDGDKRARTIQIRRAERYHYTILHYETLVNDWDTIRNWLPIDFIIGDEITAIKGFKAKRTRRMKAMRQYTPYRFGLSGQPIENRPEELFSIMEFIDPEVLGAFPKFDRTFIERDIWGKPTKYKNLPLLRKRMQDAMFRRSREDIAEWLPERVEMEIPVKLGQRAMALHDLVRDDLLVALDQAIEVGVGGGFDLLVHYGRAPKDHIETMSLRGQVMARLLAMRMLASHPALLTWSADQFDDPASGHGSQYASELRERGVLNNLPQKHEKLSVLIETIEEILAEDPKHKVVVFSYFKPMLRLIGKELSKAKVPFTTITGDVPAAERHERITQFNNDPRCKAFLSSDAGAFGISLGAGSHLLCYDFPWSAGLLNQRVSRIDRTNSDWSTITIGYMYGSGTIEERMYGQLMEKMAVADAWLDGKFDPRSGALALDLQSLREFLISS